MIHPDASLSSLRARIATLAGHEIVPYFIASLIALIVDLGVFSSTLRLLDVPWAWAATLGFAAGAVLAYQLSISWVFSKRRLRRSPRKEFAIFVGIGMAGLGLTQVVLWIGIERLHAMPELVKLVAAGATFFFNFAARKAVLFAGSEGRSN